MLPTRSSRVLFVVATIVLAAVACGGTGTTATRANFASGYNLFALTGAPANTPTAISFLGGATIANSGFGFDVAVDIDASGTTRIYPVRLLGSSLASVALGSSLKRVGLQPVSGGIDALTEAPATGYDTLSAQVVTPGTVLVAELQENSYCLYDLHGTSLYAKLVIDSIRTATRRVYARSVVDPNCGFRGLVADSVPNR